MPVLFRCFQCQQVLGTSRAKVGSVVVCPKCKAELIVPEPPTPEPAATVVDRPSVMRSASTPKLAADLSAIRPEDIRVEPGVLTHVTTVTQTSEVESHVTESGVRKSHVTESGVPASAVHTEVDVPPAPVDVPPEPPSVEPEFPAIEIKHEPILDAALRMAAAARSITPRPRDITLPRAAVVAWSLFALLGLVLAFVAGLLIGHYLWGIRVLSPP
jgi:hypothetical protein